MGICTASLFIGTQNLGSQTFSRMERMEELHRMGCHTAMRRNHLLLRTVAAGNLANTFNAEVRHKRGHGLHIEPFK
jgi:hypothetical protein